MPEVSLNISIGRCCALPFPARGVVDLAGIRLRLAHELLYGRRGKGGVHHENDRDRCRERDGSEVAQGVVRQLGIERGARREPGVVGEHQRVAVGRRLRRRFGADDAVRTHAVVDHDLMAPQLRELLRRDAGKRVDRAARENGTMSRTGFSG
jgi:hypothetical protein